MPSPAASVCDCRGHLSRRERVTEIVTSWAPIFGKMLIPFVRRNGGRLQRASRDETLDWPGGPDFFGWESWDHSTETRLRRYSPGSECCLQSANDQYCRGNVPLIRKSLWND